MGDLELVDVVIDPQVALQVEGLNDDELGLNVLFEVLDLDHIAESYRAVVQIVVDVQDFVDHFDLLHIHDVLQNDSLKQVHSHVLLVEAEVDLSVLLELALILRSVLDQIVDQVVVHVEVVTDHHPKDDELRVHFDATLAYFLPLDLVFEELDFHDLYLHLVCIEQTSVQLHVQGQAQRVCVLKQEKAINQMTIGTGVRGQALSLQHVLFKDAGDFGLAHLASIVLYDGLIVEVVVQRHLLLYIGPLMNFLELDQKVEGELILGHNVEVEVVVDDELDLVEFHLEIVRIEEFQLILMLSDYEEVVVAADDERGFELEQNEKLVFTPGPRAIVHIVDIISHKGKGEVHQQVLQLSPRTIIDPVP